MIQEGEGDWTRRLFSSRIHRDVLHGQKRSRGKRGTKIGKMVIFALDFSLESVCENEKPPFCLAFPPL